MFDTVLTEAAHMHQQNLTAPNAKLPQFQPILSQGTPLPNSPVDPPTLSLSSAFVPRAERVTRRLPRSLKKRLPRELQRRVLVVDDVNDVTDMISMFLKHAGYEVVTADRATDALKLAGERKFDLIISDIGMPEMNGYELAEALRGMSGYRSVPMIAVTGYTEYDDRGRSLGAGFNAHLTKPIEPTRLLDVINELLS